MSVVCTVNLDLHNVDELELLNANTRYISIDARSTPSPSLTLNPTLRPLRRDRDQYSNAGWGKAKGEWKNENGRLYDGM